MKNSDADLIDPESKIVMADPDKNQYKARSVKRGTDDYIETQCVVAITFDSRVAEFKDKIFDKFYSAQVGLQFFDKKATASPYSTEVTKQDTYAFLPIPEFRDEFKE